MNPKNKLAEMPIRPLLYTMAVPLMLSLLIQSLYNIVDSIFVARLSETALTAASLVYAIQFLMIAIGVGTAVGLNALLSRKLGQKKPEEACRAATTGLFLMLGTSLVFTLVGLLFPAQLLGLFSASDEMLAFGVPALRIISVTFLFAVTTILCGYFASGLGNGVVNMIGGALRQLVVLVPCHCGHRKVGDVLVGQLLCVGKVCGQVPQPRPQHRRHLRTFEGDGAAISELLDRHE